MLDGRRVGPGSECGQWGCLCGALCVCPQNPIPGASRALSRLPEHLLEPGKPKQLRQEPPRP